MTRKTLFLAVVVSSIANAASPGSLIYSSAYTGPHHASMLYVVQPATGAATAVGPIGFAEVDVLAFAPNGSLYGVGKNAADKWVLLKIDLASGAGTAVGPTGLDVPFQDIAFRSDGTLFGYVRRSGAKSKGGSVYLIDTTKGATTFTGNTSAASDDCAPVALSSDKTLYSVGQGSVESIGSTNAGVRTPLHFSPSFANPQVQVNAVKFDATSGMLWALVQTRGGGNTSYLAKIDVNTGSVSPVGKTSGQLQGLAAFEPRMFGAPLPSSLIFLLTGALALLSWNRWARSRRPRPA